jgi:L-aspartate oxidase
VVARAIAREAMQGEVYLDMREAGKKLDIKARFPGISAFLAGYGLELARDRIPVRPAAHYLMGGIRTDMHGRSSLAGLYAAGEAACTGVHGANRLASNSLLEGLVFGALAAEAMAGDEAAGNREQGSDDRQREAGNKTEDGAIDEVGVETWIAELRKLMWRDAGLLRDAAGLRRAQAGLAALRATQPVGMTRKALEARNLLVVAEAIVQAALGREESRGAHFRTDYPERASVARHSVVRSGELRFVE